MSGSATDRFKAKPGDEVTITGHPERYTWMEPLVGRRAKVENALPPAYLVSTALYHEPLWVGEGYLEERA